MACVLEKMSFYSHQVLHLIAGLFLLYVLLKAIQLYWRRQVLLKTYKPFPGPTPHWLFGNNREVRRGQELNKILTWSEKYHYAFPRWLGGFTPVLIVSHPDYAKSVFGRGDPKAMISYSFLLPWLGNGLLVLNGPKWFQHRRLLTPGFHYDVLKPYVSLMADSAKAMLDKWENLVAKEPTKSLEMFEHVSLMALDSIMKCAFSYQNNCQKESEGNHYVKAVYDLTYLVSQRIRNILFLSDFLYRCTPAGHKFQKACRLAHAHTEKVIEGRKRSFQNERELEKIQKKPYLDFLDILLCAKDENGAGLSDEDLRAEVDTFMFEGHDTTASGISWIFYSMAQHPEHQQRYLNLSMPYTTMCVKESMRLYPPVPGVSRQLSKPLTFFDGRTLPEGSLVAVSIYGIHRNPSVWQDPEVFDPMRFSPENSSRRHSHAFVPFAAGSRNCIGQQFAMNEMKVALALTLLRFEILPDPENPPQQVPQLVLKSQNGIHLRLKKLR
uniref:Cytochrome P450 family 4 subfamily B member 38 n=1 Tax=Sphenodon punctatus TaxID=8508 RepID=A0A8D0L823_SPHPU